MLLDEFSREVLKGSLMAYKALDNPLRLSQFSTGIRELIGHTLSTLAADDEVKASSWFVVETPDADEAEAFACEAVATFLEFFEILKLVASKSPHTLRP